MAWKIKRERTVCKSHPKALLVAGGAGNNQTLPLGRVPEQITAFSRNPRNKLEPQMELLNLLLPHLTDSQHLFLLVLLPVLFFLTVGVSLLLVSLSWCISLPLYIPNSRDSLEFENHCIRVPYLLNFQYQSCNSDLDTLFLFYNFSSSLQLVKPLPVFLFCFLLFMFLYKHFCWIVPSQLWLFLSDTSSWCISHLPVL